MILAGLVPFSRIFDLISAGILCGELACLSIRCIYIYIYILGQWLLQECSVCTS